MPFTIKLVDYVGWKNCILMTNGVFEAVITTEVGPRILRYSEVGGPNVLFINEFTAGTFTEALVWRSYGGRRFDYHLNGEKILPRENDPVEYEIGTDRVIFNLGADEKTGISKSIMIRMCRRGGLEIKQTMTNTTEEPVQLSVLAVTQLKSGGLGVVPWGRSNKVHSLVAGEEVDTRRIKSGQEYLFIEQDEVSRGEFEFGMLPPEQWCAYYNHGGIFVITSPALEGKFKYLDNSNVAFRGFRGFVEMETRSPIYSLGVGEEITHTEVWNIYAKHYRATTEAQVRADLKDNLYFYEFARKPICGIDY